MTHPARRPARSCPECGGALVRAYVAVIGEPDEVEPVYRCPVFPCLYGWE